MLEEFLASNRSELITRCKAKAARRFSGPALQQGVDHGVPLLLEQVVTALTRDRGPNSGGAPGPTASPSSTEVGRAAATHGTELLHRGYSVDQVVHEYGDVCQSVTELAEERHFVIQTEEFRTLNQCLDNAIADAVTSYGSAARTLHKDQTDDLHAQIAQFSSEQARLVDIATSAFAAIRAGNVGSSGATGNLLMHTLAELLHHAERVLPDIVRATSGPKTN